jgi:hypothetical protein
MLCFEASMLRFEVSMVWFAPSMLCFKDAKGECVGFCNNGVT